MTAESASSNPDQKYIAIIGDLRHSRRARNRAPLQQKLIVAVDELNDLQGASVHGDTRAASISLTAGDEVQALLKLNTDPGNFLVDVLERMSDAAAPSEFTFGIGFGAISTGLNENVALIDGPAFHHARAALDVARRFGFWASTWGEPDYAEPLNAVLALMGAVRSRWTDRQRLFIDDMGANQTQSAIAKQEGISPSVVSESLRAAAYHPYMRGRPAITALLRLMSSGTNTNP